MKYRIDIDGLRAVAIVPVVLCHVGISTFRGGYVGVDVFFVISGYLITGHIYDQILVNKFSITDFYERRVRRLAPALLAMIAFCCVLAYMYLLPAEMIDFAKTALATIFFLSNIYLWTTAGYFDGPAAEKPLLHTWSLAVEEQFYLLFPLLLVFLHKFFPGRLKATVLAIALFSLVGSAIGVYLEKGATFYLAPARAWELLLGAILALNMVTKPQEQWQRSLAGISGVVLIFWAVFMYDMGTAFPGLAAVPPCLGAALLIWSGESGSSATARLLSWMPLVFVGRISYSLYLWHWPVVVYQKLGANLVENASRPVMKIVLIGISVILAVLSWYFVETPFRKNRKRWNRVAIFQVGAYGSAVAAVLAGAALLLEGVPDRFPANAIAAATYLDIKKQKNHWRDNKCFLHPTGRFEDFDVSTCLAQSSVAKNYLLIGDSHSAHLWYGLAHLRDDINVMQATATGCTPTIDQRNSNSAICSLFMEFMFEKYLGTHHVDGIIIAARWFDKDIGPVEGTLKWAVQHHVPAVLIGPMVQYDTAVPRLAALAIQTGDPELIGRHRINQDAIDEKMAAMASRVGVKYVSMASLLCASGSCEAYAKEGVPLQFDHGHLTVEGSLFVARKLLQVGLF